MAEISKSIVHLTMCFGPKVLAIGTGSIYKKENKFYIITAWHNVTGRHPDTFKLRNEDCAVRLCCTNPAPRTVSLGT